MVTAWKKLAFALMLGSGVLVTAPAAFARLPYYACPLYNDSPVYHRGWQGAPYSNQGFYGSPYSGQGWYDRPWYDPRYEDFWRLHRPCEHARGWHHHHHYDDDDD
jgi:hypothetical protein